MTPTDLAKIGYRAYGDEAEWVNFAGNAMPSWGELPPPQRQSWEAAAAAIARAVCEGRRASTHDGPLQLADEPAGCSGPCSGSNTGGRA